MPLRTWENDLFLLDALRLLELIQESKSLMRMGIQLPESAIDVLKQVGSGSFEEKHCVLSCTWQMSWCHCFCLVVSIIIVHMNVVPRSTKNTNGETEN